MIDDRIKIMAPMLLTEPQFQVWQLHHYQGMSFRGIAAHLDLARTTVTDRYDAGCKRMRLAGVRFTPDGRPYLEEQHIA